MKRRDRSVAVARAHSLMGLSGWRGPSSRQQGARGAAAPMQPINWLGPSLNGVATRCQCGGPVIVQIRRRAGSSSFQPFTTANQKLIPQRMARRGCYIRV